VKIAQNTHWLLWVICLIGLSSSCAEVAFEEELNILLYGDFQIPADAVGTQSPRAQEYQLITVNATFSTAGTVELPIEATDSVRIVNRPQIIATAALDDYVGQTVSSVAITFASEITVVTAEGETAISLTDPTIEHTTAWTVTKGKENNLSIRAQWKNTVTPTTEETAEMISLPAFNTVMNEDN
jgi:hypothetical protein